MKSIDRLLADSIGPRRSEIWKHAEDFTPALSGCFDFGGSKESGSQVVQQSNNPWSGQQPFLTNVFDEAKNLYSQTKAAPAYPGSTVVPLSNQTETALQSIENRALAGSPLQAGANASLQQSLSGDFLSAGNPYFSQLADRVRAETLPSINAGFNAAGRTGSGLAARAASEGVADAIGALAYKNYDDERARMVQAAGLAPSIAAGDYADAQQLAGVGSTREGQAAAQLQDQINRYYYPQQQAADALSRYASTVAGGSYGSNITSQTPIYSNPTANALGSALGLVGLGNTLTAKDGLLKTLGIF